MHEFLSYIFTALIFAFAALICFGIDKLRSNPALDAVQPSPEPFFIHTSPLLILMISIPLWLLFVGGCILLIKRVDYSLKMLLYFGGFLLVLILLLRLMCRPAYILTPEGVTLNGWIRQRHFPWQNIMDIRMETHGSGGAQHTAATIVIPTTPIWGILYLHGYRYCVGQVFFLKANQQQLLGILTRWYNHFSHPTSTRYSQYRDRYQRMNQQNKL